MHKIITIALISLLTLASCTKAEKEEVSEILSEPVKVTEPEAPEVSEVSETSGGEYLAYSEEKYDSLLGQERFALFFHAEWCPTCISMEKDIKENLSKFPEGATVLVADYDSETELKQKYGIVSQSTIVIIDAEGNEVKKLAAPSSDEIITELKAS